MAVLRCIEAFAHNVKGYPDVARHGELYDSNSPVVKVGGLDRFEPVEVTVARTGGGVEQATAAPGEKRTRSTARKSTARKTTAKKAAAKKPSGK